MQFQSYENRVNQGERSFFRIYNHGAYFFLSLDRSLLDPKFTATGDLACWTWLELELAEEVFPDDDKLGGSRVSLEAFRSWSFESFLSLLPPPVPLPFFKSFNAEAGTLGVLTGSIGELVRDRDPKNRDGFSGLTFFSAFVDSNFARPLATAPEKIGGKVKFHSISLNRTRFSDFKL